jgi:hypothetical protein
MVMQPQMPPAQPQMQQVVQVAAAGPNKAQLIAMLQEALYPSQREWAAEQLMSSQRNDPDVARCLILAAREDPAATVRMMCARYLSRMRVGQLPIVETLREMTRDSDARVRHEAEEALKAIGAGR